MPSLLRDSRVRGYVALGVLAAGFGLALWPLLTVLHGQWTDIALYRHGYLLAAMAAWVAWRNLRAPLERIGPDWRYGMLVVVVLAALMLLDLLYLNVPRLYLLPPLAFASVGFVFGHVVARRVFWPLVLLYGALPIWPAINGILQSATTAAVSWGLAATGIPAFIDGNFVRLPSGTFEIAEGCSGIKYFVVSLSLALFYGLAYLPGWGARGILLAVAAASAILCNWVRVYLIIAIGHLTEMQHYLVTVEHRTFGWILYVVFLVPVFLVARRLSVDTPPAASRGMRRAYVAAGVIPVAVAVSGLLLGARLMANSLSAPAGDDAVLVEGSGDSAEGARSSPWQPVFRNAHESWRSFGAGGGAIQAYRASYPRQTETQRLIAYGNAFVPAEWRPVDRRSRQASMTGTPLEVVELEGFLGPERRLVWGWYIVAGEPAIHPLKAKLLEVKGIFLGRRDAAAVALSSVCDVDCGGARESLEAFLEQSEEFRQWMHIR